MPFLRIESRRERLPLLMWLQVVDGGGEVLIGGGGLRRGRGGRLSGVKNEVRSQRRGRR